MAIDPRILSAIGVDTGGTARALNAFTNIRSSQERAQAADDRSLAQQEALAQSKQQAPLRNELLQAQVESTQIGNEASRNKARQLNVTQRAQELTPFLEAGDIEGARARIVAGAQEAQSRGRPLNDSQDALDLLNSNPQALLDASKRIVERGFQTGILKRDLTSGQREFSSLTKGLSDEDANRARRIELGLDPRASTSAQERIAVDQSLTSQVAASQAEIEGEKAQAREGGKLVEQRKHLPEIRKEIKLAEKSAIERGDVLSSLERSKAALPGLLNAVDQLKELAPIATSTFGGKIFDAATKQTGFGSTKGATARAKFVAIINNQVLPLLKETFGAAFTAQEGESLKATMGDPDASPAEKMVQLDAFIAQKQRDIQTRETQLNLPSEQVASPTVIRFDAQGNQI